MKISKKQIDKVFSGFNFESAAEVYKLLKWKWWHSGIPNADDLREKAIQLLGDLRESTKYQSISAGGLRVTSYMEDKYTLIVKLEFITVSSVNNNLDLE